MYLRHHLQPNAALPYTAAVAASAREHLSSNAGWARLDRDGEDVDGGHATSSGDEAEIRHSDERSGARREGAQESFALSSQSGNAAREGRQVEADGAR